jgi:hypothetical protein
MNTNSPERSGEAPLLERFILRFYIFSQRAVPHALVMGAPTMPVEVKRGIRREFLIQRTLSTIVSKLQTDGILSFPSTLVFKSFYERFLAQLRDNPWIDCDPPTAGDRRSSIIENLYGFLVNRCVIQRLFVEPGAPHANKPFTVDLLLDLEREMATGDTQTAILAIGSYSHSFRSPTEYRVAALLTAAVVTRLKREYARCAAETPAGPKKDFFEAGPCHSGAWSPAQEASLTTVIGTNRSEEADRYLGPNWVVPTGHRPELGSRYVPIMEMKWGPKTPNKWDVCEDLSSTLLEGQAGNVNRIMHDHAQKRIHLLSTTGARCGPDAGHPPVYLHADAGSRTTYVLALASWLDDTTRTYEHSMHQMLKRAAMACSYTAPGTYLTLEPFTFDRNAELAAAFPNDKGVPAKGSIPKMLPCFTVPVHGPALDAGGKATAAACGVSSGACTCFRSRRLAAQMGVEEVYVDPQVAALRRFRDTRKADAVMPPVCTGAQRTYPLDCLASAMEKNSATRGVPRNPDEVELEIQEEYLARMRTGGVTEVGVDV